MLVPVTKRSGWRWNHINYANLICVCPTLPTGSNNLLKICRLESLPEANAQIRSPGLKRTAEEVGEIDMIATSDGRNLKLNDIAKVSEAFKDSSQTALRNGQLAIELNVRRAVNTDALEIAERVRAYLVELNQTMPPTLTIEQYDERARSIEDRISLLVNNGASGLVLVLLVLFIFLNARVAIWVAVGIPAAMLAAVAVMWVSGQTINMLSLFGMIMAIGIVVDDAIVVGEHAETRFQQGLSPLDASIAGAHRMGGTGNECDINHRCCFHAAFSGLRHHGADNFCYPPLLLSPFC